MVFSNSMFLFLYLPIVMTIYFISPIKLRNLWLLIASLIFYGWGEPIYILIMFLSTACDYFNGYMVSKSLPDKKKAKKYVIFAIIINFSLLGFFKYYDFFVLNINSLLGSNVLTPLNIALPIGISFYTFQSMSYTIDVYRGQAKAQRKFIPFATFVVLFPQLVAGPIVTYNQIADELNHRKESWKKFGEGLRIFSIGLAKKVIIANNVGLIWDTVRVDQGNSSIVLMWFGIIAYALQIYFDFSGYSDMAIGLGRMFGFHFPMNFNYPYISKSATEFWRRWHMTLGSWFRDYVYIPLGGNRVGKVKNIRNILIVWFLTGFWHGAAWNFIFWGLYFGVLLIIEKTFLLKILEKLPHWIQHSYLTIIVLISWVLFYFENTNDLFHYLSGMFGFNSIPLLNDKTIFYVMNSLGYMSLAIFAALPLFNKVITVLENKFKTFGFVVEVYHVVLLIISISFVISSSYNPFLYFRF